MDIEIAKQQSWIPNRVYQAQTILVRLTTLCEGRSEITTDLEYLMFQDFQIGGDEFKTLRNLMIEQGWIEIPNTGGAYKNKAKLTPYGRDLALRLGRKSEHESHLDYILLLVHSIVGGSVVEPIFSADLLELVVIPFENAHSALAAGVEDRYLRMEGVSANGRGDVYLTARGIRYCEDINKEKPTEIFTPMSTVNYNFNGSATNFAIGDQAKIDITNQTGMSGDEVAELFAEVRETLTSMQAGDREMLETLFNLIGKLSAEPETEKEARSAATAAKMWLEKIGDKVTEKVTVDTIISMGKAAYAGYLLSQAVPAN